VVRLKQKTDKLAAQNRALLDQDLEWAHANTPYKALLQVIADILDNAVNGGDSFVSIGLTTDKASVCFMVQLEGQRDRLYALDLRTLDEQAQSLL